ncbi:MAG: hypothetical protein GF311_01155 [Candidatus Lokiarchaeota archaeon]|nr:hypothetical protein [Candidatus Lokiarchaeota archaeon]
MNLVLEIILWSIIAFALLCIFVYLLLPWIFKIFVSPYFNASYVYDSRDFEQKEKILSEQINIPELSINPNNGIFRISFGNSRILSEGVIKLHSKGNYYSNLRRLSRKTKLLNLIKSSHKESDEVLGNFKETVLEYELTDQNVQIIASIKQYHNQNYIIFEIKFPDGLTDTATGKFEDLIVSFPSFFNKSPNTRIFTYREAIFCPPSRKLNATSAPVVLYDDELNCMVLCPLDGFLNATISEDKEGWINCGIQGEITSLPKNFSQKFILYFGKGINNPMEEVGNLLLRYHNSERKNLYVDIVCSHLGFWTDNGAYYYYKTEKGLNYEDTLVAIKDYFEEKDIPIRYFNFDSWWYLKHTNKAFTTVFRPIVRLMGGGLYGNTLRWETDPEKFSTDLKTFYEERFQIPITAHNRRWDSRSPYLDEYEFITYKNHACPLNLDFWEWLMQHAKESGILVYEQDWMNNQINSIPYLREDVNAIERWLNSMAIAAEKNGIDVFYCMETPGIILYSIKHPNITITRCSGDYNHRWPLSYRYVHSTQTNILIHSVGLISHPDVFRSRSMEGVSMRPFGEKRPILKCLYQNLNAGPVCPGDKKEYVNWSILSKTCRDDGLLLKPDKPLTANDLMFKPHKKYYICDTYIKREDLIWRFILITNIWPNRVKERYFTLEELGYNHENFILYDYFANRLEKVNSSQKIEIGKLEKYGYKYYILNPIFENGLSFIGCVDKFIPCSRKLIVDLNSKNTSLTFVVNGLKDANLKILLYSETKPEKIHLDDHPLDFTKSSREYYNYDEANKLLSIYLRFKEDTKKTVEILI